MSDENIPGISESDSLDGFAYDLQFSLNAFLRQSGINGINVKREQVAGSSSRNVPGIRYRNGYEIRLVREHAFSIPFFINPIGNYIVEIFGTNNSVQPMRQGLSAQECLLAARALESALRYFSEQTERNPPWQDETEEGKLSGYEFYFLACTRNRFEELEVAVAEKGLRARPIAIGCDDSTQRIERVPLRHLVESGTGIKPNLADIMKGDALWAATYRNPNINLQRRAPKNVGAG